MRHHGVRIDNAVYLCIFFLNGAINCVFFWKKKLTVRDVEGVYELEVGFDAVKEGRQRQNLFSYYRL
jgi:hypothetical protein